MGELLERTLWFFPLRLGFATRYVRSSYPLHIVGLTTSAACLQYINYV